MSDAGPGSGIPYTPITGSAPESSSDHDPDTCRSPSFVLVMGTTFAITLPCYKEYKRLADMTGRTLARAGFGLIAGNPPGVDRFAAKTFWSECKRLGPLPDTRYQQLWLPHFRRGYWLPGAGFKSPSSCIIRLRTTREWIEEAITRAGAAVMIGGRSGSLAIARRLMDAGKPVLPIPFAGGESQNVFHELLRTWEAAPVPGLSKSQFLRLDIPWINGTGQLANLLLGTLAHTADIFISYRRNDSAVAAGRLNADLVDHFGMARVFMDLHGIAPSSEWRPAIDRAIEKCKVAVIVIGPNFLAKDGAGNSRLLCDDDVVRHEIEQLLLARKSILPVLVDGAQLPSTEILPEEFRPLLNYQSPSINNSNWADVMNSMISAIELALRRKS